jgi:hypothetical protein
LGSSNYIWLKNLLDNDFKGLNDKRKSIVHYSSHSTDIYDAWLKNVNDEKEIKKIQNDIENLTDYFKDHLNKALTGFEKATRLVDEIP